MSSPWRRSTTVIVMGVCIYLAAFALRPGGLYIHTHDGARELVVAVARLVDTDLPGRGPEIGPLAVTLGAGYTRVATAALTLHPSITSLVVLHGAIAMLASVLLGLALFRRYDSVASAAVGSLVFAASSPVARSVELMQHSALLPTLAAVWLAALLGRRRASNGEDTPPEPSHLFWHILEVAAAVAGSHVHILFAPLSALTGGLGLVDLVRRGSPQRRVAGGLAALIVAVAWWPILIRLLNADHGAVMSYTAPSGLPGLSLPGEVGATGLLGDHGGAAVVTGLALAVLGLVRCLSKRDVTLLVALVTATVAVAAASTIGGAHARYVNLLTPFFAVLVGLGLTQAGRHWRPAIALLLVTSQCVDLSSGMTLADPLLLTPEPNLVRCEELVRRDLISDARRGSDQPDPGLARERRVCDVIPGGLAVTALVRLSESLEPSRQSARAEPHLAIMVERGQATCRTSNPHVPIAWLEEHWLSALGAPLSPMLTRCLGSGETAERSRLTITVEGGAAHRAPPGWTWVVHVVARASQPVTLAPEGDAPSTSWSLGNSVGLDISVGSDLELAPIGLSGPADSLALAASVTLVPTGRDLVALRTRPRALP